MSNNKNNKKKGHQSRQHPIGLGRLDPNRRLRCERVHIDGWRRDTRQGEAHVRGYAMLDGARSHGAEAVGLRHESGHLVAGHHGHRVGLGHGALSQVPAHEGAHDDAAERAAHARLMRRGEGPIQELLEDLPQDDLRVLTKGSVRETYCSTAS